MRFPDEFAHDPSGDDILTVPYPPEELLARSVVITRRASDPDRPERWHTGTAGRRLDPHDRPS